MVDNILVPVDGSEQFDKALMKALEIAEAEKGSRYFPRG
jgi:nucleotide-binding universal stress UspA family protein